MAIERRPHGHETPFFAFLGFGVGGGVLVDLPMKNSDFP